MRSRLLVAISLLIRQISIKVAFIKGEFERDIHIVSQLASCDRVKTFQMNCEDARHCTDQSISQDNSTSSYMFSSAGFV